MMNRVWLLSLILAVPLFGFAVSEGIQAHLNSELRSAMRQQYPDLDPGSVAQLSFDQVCETPNPKLHSICSRNRNLNLMSAAAVWAAGIGLILLVVIRFAGSAAKTNRSLLLSSLRAGPIPYSCIANWFGRRSRRPCNCRNLLWRSGVTGTNPRRCHCCNWTWGTLGGCSSHSECVLTYQ